MDRRLGDQNLPPTTPLKPTLLGRGLPVPPVVVLVAVAGVLIGLALGYGIAPKPSSPPASSPTTATASLVASPLLSASPGPSVAPTSAPTASAYELPPGGGLTLTEALAMLTKSGMGISPSAVISARVERYGEASLAPVSGSADEWVWAIVVRGTFPPFLWGGYQPPEPRLPATTEMIILDYRTGAFLETLSPAFP
ncbi:MAG: hypothetical protein ABSA21_13445 [Candidatus Limnocylindrales bacterium]|jgi:hypothetical protein